MGQRMLVRFALSPESFGCSESIARRVLQVWMRSGVFFYREDLLDGAPRVVQKHLKRGLRNAWSVKVPATAFPSDIGLMRSHLAVLPDEVELVAVGAHDAQTLGLSATGEDEAEPVSQAEVVLAERIDLARSVRRSVDMAESPIPKGYPVRELWDQRFAPVVNCATRACVVDRYALKRLASRKQGGGLARFLEWSRDSKLRYVKVIAEPAGLSAADLSRALGGGGTRIEIYCVDAGVWSSEVVDRWIQFDRFVFEIGHGLEVLEGDVVDRMNLFTFKRVSDELVQAAVRLQGKARQPLVLNG